MQEKTEEYIVLRAPSPLVSPMEQIVGLELKVPPSALGGSDSEEVITINVQEYYPNYCGQECYRISTGWTCTIVTAQPLYQYWYNVIRRFQRFQNYCGLPVYVVSCDDGTYRANHYGKVLSVATEETKETLHVEVAGHEGVIPHMMTSADNLALVKAGQMRDLGIDLTELNIVASDDIIICIRVENMEKFNEDMSSYGALFMYGKIGVMNDGVRIISDRLNMDEMVNRKAEFTIGIRFLFPESQHAGIHNARVRAIGYDSNSNLLHVQVISSVNGYYDNRIVTLDANKVYGMYSDISLLSLGKVSRPMLTRESFTYVLEAQKRHIEALIQRKGYGCFASKHEILGIITDELKEARDAIHEKLSDEELIHELQDIATGALWGIASLRSGAMSW